MPNTTWNPSDKSANITLSGGNLTATGTTVACVRTISSHLSGKYYFEVTATSVGTNAGIGIANSTHALTAYLGSDTASISYDKNGGIFYNNANIYANGAYVNGNVICVAVDIDNGKIWWRIGSGNWNNSGTANPATNTGGITLSPSGPYFPCIQTETGGDVVTANFGDSSFTGTVPSGFTSGWPAALLTSAQVTQIAAEHWLTTNPPARVTQVALEHWATTTGVVVTPAIGPMITTIF
jgi:SPRY domain